MNILKNGGKLMAGMIVAVVISFFLCISINIICSAAFTKEIGYKAFVYESETAEKSMAEYEYEYVDKDGDGKDDGTDTKMKEYEDKGYFVTTEAERSTLTGVGKGVFLATSQVLTFIMLVAFASGGAYKQGFKDINLVKIEQIKEDKLKGLKIGLIGNIPFFVLFIAAVVTANVQSFKIPVVWYAFLNSQFYPVIMMIKGTAETLSQLEIGQFILLFILQLIVPAIAAVAYILGYKEINVFEKMMYKKEDR
ncbi:MAG: hypothetical protein Q4B40_02190 [Clostridia bacterium]|nr:hypothetical protein [Clostridia bacterium]